MKRKILTTVLFLCLVLVGIFAFTSCGEDETPGTGGPQTPTDNTDELKYQLSNDGTYYIVSGTSSKTSEKAVIPSTHNNLPVKSIGTEAFFNCTSLTSVTIGDNITSISNSAFEGCTGLTSIEIPGSVTSISYNAFYGCKSLTNVTIGSGITSIGQSAFSGCNISRSNLNTYDNAYYLGNENEPYLVLMRAKDESITSCEIHEDTKVIYDGAFYNCTSLASIEIPDSVTSIGGNAFSLCDSLQHNTHDNAYYLGNESNPYLALIKAKDASITSCEIYEDTKFIYSGAFANCEALMSVNIGSSVISIGNMAFANCKSLTSITIPNSVTSIDCYAFFRCTNLLSIEIPDSVTSIGQSVFYSCTSLTNASIGNSVTLVGEWAFCYCESLTSVIISDSVPRIGFQAFAFCESLTSITFAGAKEQWEAIGKGDYWNYSTGNYTIHCTDGDITKS